MTFLFKKCLEKFVFMEKNTYVCSMKICRTCEIEKSLDNFWRDEKVKDGYYRDCKECSLLERRRNRAIKKGYYITGEEVVAEEIDFDNTYPKTCKSIPGGRDRKILNDMITSVQEFYGVTLSDMQLKRRSHRLSFPRFHFFWFVEHHREKTYYDNERFAPSTDFCGAVVALDHSMFNYGAKVIKGMISTYADFREIHERLYHNINEKLTGMNIKKIETLPVSKTEISSLAKDFVSYVGETGGALTKAASIAALEEFVKKVKADPEWKDIVRDELKDGETEVNGVSIKPIESGVKYDYSVCQCSEWDTLDTKIKELTDSKKSLEEKLKMVAKGTTIINEETGEVYLPPTKTSTSTYQVSLKK